VIYKTVETVICLIVCEGFFFLLFTTLHDVSDGSNIAKKKLSEHKNMFQVKEKLKIAIPLNSRWLPKLKIIFFQKYLNT
jgi:hypothetical protein